jgi:WD40 repeat protein
VTSENVEPVVRLQGHTAEGFGLDWNKQKHNYIASGSMDGKICIWDVAGSKETDSSLNPSLEYTFHSGGVEDVNWNKVNPNILGSSGQDKLIAMYLYALIQMGHQRSQKDHTSVSESRPHWSCIYHRLFAIFRNAPVIGR